MRRSGLGIIAAIGLLTAVLAGLVFTVSGFRLPDPFHTDEPPADRLPAASVGQYRDALSYLAVDSGVELIVAEGSAEHYLWVAPPGRDAWRVTLAGPVSGRWRVEAAFGGDSIAALGGSSDAGGTLLVGTPERLGVIGTGVLSFQWHQVDPAAMAWISQVGTERWLRVAHAGVTSPVVSDVAVVSSSAQLVAFGSWGYLLSESGRVVRLDSEGRSLTSLSGRVWSVGADGVVIVGTGTASSLGVTTIDLEEPAMLDVPVPPGTATRHVEWMAGRRRLAIADVITGDEPQTRIRLVGLDGLPTNETIIQVVTNRMIVSESEGAIVFGGPEGDHWGGTHRLSVWRPEEGVTHSIVANDWLFPIAAR